MPEGVETKPNFFLWGKLGGNVLPKPALQKKIPEDIIQTIVSDGCMISLSGSGKVLAWGASTTGCLGLGEQHIVASPTQVQLPEDAGRVLSLAKGTNHILAATDTGAVFAWGTNSHGQLGIGNPTGSDIHCSPVRVQLIDEKGQLEQAAQICCLKNTSFAVTTLGNVYCWGSNEDGLLGLQVESKLSGIPVRNQAMNTTINTDAQEVSLYVTRLEVSRETILAYVDIAAEKAPKIGQRTSSPVEGSREIPDEVHGGTNPDSEEATLYESIDALRATLDKARNWATKLEELNLPQDSLYTQEISDKLLAQQKSTIEDLMWNVDQELQPYIPTDEFTTHGKFASGVGRLKSAQNIVFILSMFLDNLKMKYKRLVRIDTARQVVACKRKCTKILGNLCQSFRKDWFEDTSKLQSHNAQLQEMMNHNDNLKTHDILSAEIQGAIRESLLAKIQTNDTKMELILATMSTPAATQQGHVGPAMKILKDRWTKLQEFSLYRLFATEGKAIFHSRKLTADMILEKLVHLADKQIDDIIKLFEEDGSVSKDVLVPSFCYDLLVDNCRLRKLCNQYQLRVLMLHRGKQLTTDPEAMLPEDEKIFACQDGQEQAASVAKAPAISVYTSFLTGL